MTSSLVTLQTSNMHKNSVQPSFLKLIQGMTRTVKGRPGQILDVQTQDVYDSLTVVFFDSDIQRVLYPFGEHFSKDVLCRSVGGLYPDPASREPQAESCGTCKWEFEKHINKQGKIISKPYCKRSLKVGLISAETKLPHYLDCTGESESPARNAIEALNKALLKNAAIGRMLLPIDFQFKISAVLSGNIYKLNVEGPTEVQDESIFGPVYQIQSAQWLAA
jgi:hypothetical protein